jgi:hypothetical protein
VAARWLLKQGEWPRGGESLVPDRGERWAAPGAGEWRRRGGEGRGGHGSVGRGGDVREMGKSIMCSYYICALMLP